MEDQVGQLFLGASLPPDNQIGVRQDGPLPTASGLSPDVLPAEL
jgi:hypothetical protein